VDGLIFSCATPRLYLRSGEGYLSYDVSSFAAKVESARTIRAHLKTLNHDERTRAIEALQSQVGFLHHLSDQMEERYGFLDWDEVKLMSQGLMEFGSHSHSHPILSTLGRQDLESELRESKRVIESHLGRPCDLFSYPNGEIRDFSLREELALRRHGYRAAFTQIRGFNQPGDNAFELKRINISRSRSLSYFKALLSGIASQLMQV